MNDFLTLFVCLFFPPCKIKNKLLNILGHNIDRLAYVGNSFIWKSSILMEPLSVLSGLSLYIRANIHLDNSAKIGFFNIFVGDFLVSLLRNSEVSNFCVFKNSGLSIIPEVSSFELGEYSKITSHHYFDMSSDITIGSNSVLGGRDIQAWTHGFVHFDLGKSRYIKFGEIVVGDGVYIGARSVLNPGVFIGNGVCFAASSSIAGSYTDTGFYAPQRLRKVSELDKNLFLVNKEVDFGFKCGNPMFK